MPSFMLRHRSRRCPGYAKLWAGDQRRKLFENLKAGPHTVAMLTITAPGVDLLPWDTSVCAALGDHEHNGELGCRVREPHAAIWNASAPERWRRLNRRAHERVQARMPGAKWLLGRVWEKQHRGVLHVHPVVAYVTKRQRAAVRMYRDELERLAPKYGFGFVGRKLEVKGAKSAAGYLASYFVTGRKDKLTLWQSVMDPEMPRSIIYVSPRLTMQTGCTIRRLRFHRYVYVCHGSTPLCEGDSWFELDRYEASVSGVRLRRAHAPPGAAHEVGTAAD